MSETTPAPEIPSTETPSASGGTEERLARLEQEVKALLARLDKGEAHRPQPASGVVRPPWRERARTRWGSAHRSFRRSSVSGPALTVVVGLVTAAAILVEVID